MATNISEGEWRCVACNKVKDLRGAHLNGKHTVRSDCWPCAKKQTFRLVSEGSAMDKNQSAANSDGKTASAAPVFLFSKVPAAAGSSSQPPAPSNSFLQHAFPSSSSQKTAPPLQFANPFAAAAPVTAAVSKSVPASATPAAAPFQFGGGKTGNPFLVAAAGPSQSQTSGSTHHTSTILMQPTPAPQRGPHPSPPFSFVAAKTAAPAPPTFSLTPASTAAGTGEEVWRCTYCSKIKDLRGPHLNGKNSVRSDCWPCAQKRTFVRYDPSGKPMTDLTDKRPPRPSNLISQPASPQTILSTSTSNKTNTGSHASTPEPASTTDTLKTSSSFGNDASPIHPFKVTKASAFLWSEPDIPTAELERQFFLSTLMPSTSAPSSTSSSSPHEHSLSAAFYEKTLQSYLKHVRDGDFTHGLPIIWNSGHKVAYVLSSRITSSVPQHTVPLSAMQNSLGELASIFVHLETVIPNAHRIFCADTYTFAAASMYRTHLNKHWAVYGPAHDKTTQRSLVDEIVCALDGHSRVTSGDQRNAAVKSLWIDFGISATPNSAVGEAIRKEEAKSSHDGVDVVLIPKCASHEECSQFRLLIA